MMNVALVDDQTLVRSGIVGLLNLTPDIRVVAQAADGLEAMVILEQMRFAVDVVLLDVRMPHCSGIELLKAHSSVLPPTILLTTFDDDAALFEGMKNGAKGFLLKDISLERLAAGIRSVASGETLFRPALTERARASYEIHSHHTGKISAKFQPGLSRRETEILALMAAGLSNAEIADGLNAAEGTVKNHVSNILVKLNVRNRIRAVLRGLELGYI